jgi:hypothetical protein
MGSSLEPGGDIIGSRNPSQLFTLRYHELLLTFRAFTVIDDGVMVKTTFRQRKTICRVRIIVGQPRAAKSRARKRSDVTVDPQPVSKKAIVVVK